MVLRGPKTKHLRTATLSSRLYLVMLNCFLKNLYQCTVPTGRGCVSWLRVVAPHLSKLLALTVFCTCQLDDCCYALCPHVGLIHILLITNEIEVFLTYKSFLFCEIPIHVFCPFFSLWLCLFFTDSYDFFIYSGYQFLSFKHVAYIFSQFVYYLL